MSKFNEWCGKFTKKKAFSLLNKMKWTWLIITDSKKGVHIFNSKNEYRTYGVKTVKKTAKDCANITNPNFSAPKTLTKY